ncbi:ABC transporter ATP-binding protein [Halomonas sp. HAL1]|uniref:ABC transporter ATP-binding protein n=1 Tax=Halomonas sp. HAL1 TaxID=550984 RepID=UPI00022D3039|nr:ABC transporter ATP-binding protein [Halomonas sp. HAL1]EHA13638.1 ABC transporter-like protein [Halomonas sp. HAL1]WKV91616.1 ABC transporter ATP-binding protein [Halomonas sp. HAL1]|tara:strand:- start:220 stop:915 length:696 start_codon:yes stop_codon:yes gene_type:complete
MSLLTFRNVNSFYGKAQVLHDVSFSVNEGDKVGFIGRNGVGKTTVVNSCIGVASVKTGEVLFNGEKQKAIKYHNAALSGISIVPQGRNIFSNLTVKENLIMGLASGRSGYWDLTSVYKLFPILEERQNSMGTAMSGGQQQMLAIGRALMANPKLLILDEPSEGLSPVMVDQLADSLDKLSEQGTSIMLVEQNISLLARCVDSYYLLSKGKIVDSGKINNEYLEELKSHIAI